VYNDSNYKEVLDKENIDIINEQNYSHKKNQSAPPES
jgi:hypothetical protein